MVNKISFILILLFGIAANAQIPKEQVSVDTSVFPQETVELSINSNLLLAGEPLQYKCFALNASKNPSELSKVLYVSLRNQQDSIVFNHKLRVENGTCNGDFFIPSSLETGIYTLIGYTNYSRNNSENSFFQKHLYIINTFVKNKSFAKISDTLKLQTRKIDITKEPSNLVNSGMILIKTDKDSYAFREKVKLNIEPGADNLSGNFSLSIRKVNPVEISGEVARSSPIPGSELFYIPELRGELISGVVYSKTENKPIANQTLSLTVPGKDYIFNLAKTNAQGRFFFSVFGGYDADESVIQLIKTERDTVNISLRMDNKEFNLENKPPSFIKLDHNLKSWLEERSVQLQIENAYFDVKKDSILANKINPSFYDNLGTEFLLDDYTRFPTVRETFVEVVTLAAVRGSGETSRFLVYNAYDPNRLAKFNDLPPLVLMDGMLVQNNNEVLNYNAREIKSIRVVPQPYRYGPKVYSGIIAIETKTGNFVPKLSKDYVEKIKLSPAIKEKQRYTPDYTNITLSRIPDYRVQLLWEPALKLKNQNYSTDFYASDVEGVYEIVLKGYTTAGDFISTSKFISVE